MPKHHCAGPDLSDGIGNPFPCDVGSRPMDWLEHRRVSSLGIQISRRRNPDGTGNGRAQIGKNVAEQVRSHNDVKPVRMTDKMSRQNIDVILIGANVRKLLADDAEPFVPERHGVNDAIGFCGGGHVRFAFPCQLECESQYSIHPATGEVGLLHGHLLIRVSKDSAAHIGVLAFIVYANDAKIDLPRLNFSERRFNPLQQTPRAQIRILLKTAPDRNQKSPQRNVIGDPRIADRAEKNGVEGTKLLKAVVGHNFSRLQVVLETPIKILAREFQIEAAPGRFEHAQSFRYYFFSDAIAWNNRNLESFHLDLVDLPFPSCSIRFFRCGTSTFPMAVKATPGNLSEHRPWPLLPVLEN